MLLPQLENSEHARAYHLLQLFAYGTLLEYNSEPPPTSCCCVLCLLPMHERRCHTSAAKWSWQELRPQCSHGSKVHAGQIDACAGRSASLPSITEEQRLKLRQLTIISIAEDKKVGAICVASCTVKA